MAKLSYRWGLIAIILAVVLAAIGTGCSASQPTPEQIAEDVIALLNAERQAAGLNTLVVNEHLMLMAQWRSQDMVDGDYYDHYPPPGHPTLGDLCERLGYDSLLKPKENLMYVGFAEGQELDGAARGTIESWRNSPNHWLFAMSPDIEMTGVGVVIGDDHIIITQLFWAGGLFTPSTAYQHNRE